MEDDSKTVPEQETSVNIGEHLRQAREAAGLSVEDVANELRIHLNYVEDVESNVFDNLNGPTYVKGYLRNYARLLELDSEPLIASYQSTMGEEPSWQATHPRQREHLHRKGLLTGSILIAVIMLALFATWLLKSGYLDSYDIDQPASATSTDTPVPDDSVADAAPESETAGSVSLEPSTPTPLPALVPGTAGNQATETAAPTPVQEPETDTSSSAAESKSDENTIILGEDDIITAPGDDFTDEIIITFTDECWVEIVDAGRHKLMHGLYQAGDIKIVLGQAPFQVFLGNASAVDIDFNGVKFDIAGNTRRNNTARFALVSQ